MTPRSILVRVAAIVGVVAALGVVGLVRGHGDIEDPHFLASLLWKEVGFAACAVAAWWVLLRKSVPIRFEGSGWGSATKTIPIVVAMTGVFVLGIATSTGLDRSLLARLVLTVVFVAVSEEMVFRVILMDGLIAAGRPVRAAIFTSSLVFGAVHLTNYRPGMGIKIVFQVLFAFGFGHVLGRAYTSVRNLGYPLLLHFVWDAAMVSLKTFGSFAGQGAGGGVVFALLLWYLYDGISEALASRRAAAPGDRGTFFF